MDATMHVSAGAPSVAWRPFPRLGQVVIRYANVGLANQVDAWMLVPLRSTVYAVYVRVSYNDMLLLQ